MIPLTAAGALKKVGKFILAYLPYILALAFILLPWVLWLDVRSDYKAAEARLSAIKTESKAQEKKLDTAAQAAKVEIKEVVKYQTKIERQVEKVYVHDKASYDWSVGVVPDAVCDSLSARYCASPTNTE